jgi:hypothetical protein
MKNCTYSTSIEVAFPPEIVFENVNYVSKWWPEEFEGRSAELDDEFTWRSGDMHYSRQQVVEFVPNEKVVWLTIESMRKPDNYDWTGATYTFELTSRGNITALNFTYDGPVPEDEYDMLAQVCDMVIKQKLYNFITESKTV